jgi:hypothetical protein
MLLGLHSREDAAMTKARALIAGVLLVVIAYFVVIPMFWGMSSPSVTAGIPEAWPHDTDMPIPVEVSAPHANFSVANVRLTPDPEQARAGGPPLYPQVLYSGEQKREWTRLTLNRFTWPRRRRIEVVWPLASHAAEGSVCPGVFKGRIEVAIDWVSGLHQFSGPTVRADAIKIFVPMEVQLQ